MATESPLIHDGSQTVLSTANDARRSSITGATLAGPNGSGQFLCVALSTTVDRTVTIASTAPAGGQILGNRAAAYGVLQNTPGPGQAADVGLYGISKVVAGTTTIGRGGAITPSSTSSGTVSAASTTTLQYGPIGFALESPSAVGAVISAFIGQYNVVASTA